MLYVQHDNNYNFLGTHGVHEWTLGNITIGTVVTLQVSKDRLLRDLAQLYASGKR